MKKYLLVIVLISLGGIIWLFSDRSGLLKEGVPAPPFTGQLSTGESVSLGDYAGKKNVVLFFYPRDFSAGCTKEVCSYRDNFSEVQKFDAVMLGVSYDDERSHAAFAGRYQLPFPLISDTDKRISKAYGAARFGGVLGPPRRVTYLIDKKGIIRKVAHHEFAIENHIDDVLDALRKLQ